jgi:hypothetical protein
MCIVPQKVFKEEGIMLQLRRIIAYFQNRNICQDSQNIYYMQQDYTYAQFVKHFCKKKTASCGLKAGLQ